MGYPLSLVLAVLFAMYSLATMFAIFAWEKNSAIDINHVTDTINFVLCGVLTVCAWFFQQSTYVDLDRMMQEIGNARVQGIGALFTEYETQPLSFALLMVGYWTGDRRVLQVIGCFLTYGLAMLIIAELKRLLRPDPIAAFLGTMLYWIRPGFVTAVTNIRFWIAMELLLLAAVLWVRTRKWKVPACLVVSGALLHAGVLPVLIGFFLAMVSSKFLFCLFSAVVALYSAFTLQIVTFLSSSAVSFLAYIGKRMAEYFGAGVEQGAYDSAMLAVGANMVGVRMLYVVIPMALLYFVLKSSLSTTLPAGMERFIIFELMFVLCSSQSYTVFIRYTVLALYLMIPIVFCCLNRFFQSDIERSSRARSKWMKRTGLGNLAFLTLFTSLLFILFVLLLRQWNSAYYSSSIVFLNPE